MLQRAVKDGAAGEILARLGPALTVLAAVPVVAWPGASPAWRAVAADAALFAAMHAQTWPSPVPLFLLALALGWVAVRTRSLVGPVLMHGAFNAVSVVYLLAGGVR